jgi:hypothetical protein
MGGIMSTQHLTSPVTINRMRYACQRDSTLPYNVRKHHVVLLANDLNKLGFKVPLKDSTGKTYSAEKMCEHISEAIPNVKSVCMISKKNEGNIHDAIKKLVHHFNSNYGANIRLYKNEYAPKTSENMRKYEDVCDDLYMVEDRILRQLSDNTNYVKRNLLQNIALLRQYKEQLNKDFQQYFTRLQSGESMDIVRKKMRAAQILKHSLTSEIEKQLEASNDGYKNLLQAYNKQVNPLLGTARISLNTYAGLPFGHLGGNNNNKLSGGGLTLQEQIFGNKLSNLIIPSIAIGQAADKCMNCVQKFGMTVDEFNNNTSDFIRHKVRAKALKAMNEATLKGNPQEVQKIQNCLHSLLTDAEYINKCKRAISGHSGYVHAQEVLNTGHCYDLQGEEDCLKDPSCIYDKQNDKCVSMKNPDVLNQLTEEWKNKLLELKQKGVSDPTGLAGVLDPLIEGTVKPQAGIPSVKGLTGIGHAPDNINVITTTNQPGIFM